MIADFSPTHKAIRRGCSPPGTGGEDAPSIKCREATFERRGRGGQFRNFSSRLTTPSALLKVASRNFLTRAATPPVPGGELPRLMTFAQQTFLDAAFLC